MIKNDIFYFQWHITEQCNNNCKHCYSRGKRLIEETTLEDFSDILDDIIFLCNRWRKNIHIALAGGDPLLHNHFTHFIQILHKMPNVTVSVAGNPETLTSSLMKWLKKKISTFQVSVDGTQETHDWFRYQGSYETTMDCIKRAKQEGLRVDVMTTISKKNVNQVVNIMDVVYKAGAVHWTFARYVPPVGIIDDIVSPDEFEQMLMVIEEAHKKYESNHKRLIKDPLLFPFRNFNCPPNPKVNAEYCQLEGCGIGSLMLTILPNNNIMACRRHSGSVLGKWKKRGDIQNIFLHSSTIKKLREIEKIRRCKNCVFLYYCRGCRAVGYAIRGSLVDPDPSCKFFIKQRR